MNYIKAKDVLPEEIIKLLQKYIDGKCIYIPKKDENHLPWGEKSGIKNSLKIRNSEIYKKYTCGATIDELAQEYYLSEKSIRRIITQEKQLYAHN